MEGEDPGSGHLAVRASGVAAARAAILGVPPGPPERLQVVMRCPVPRRAVPTELDAGECGLRVAAAEAGPGVVALTVATARLSIGFAQLRPLMFRPVPVEPGLRSVFASAVAHVLAAAAGLDERGLAHYLVGLAELVLRSALRAELDRVDALAARRRDALAYIRANLSDPELGAERVAAALFVSRRRLYQMFDDGQGVSERIRGLRLDRAKELLADPVSGARGIADVAKDCGFVSAAHFSRTFRQAFGLTPGQYRQRHRSPAR